MKQHSFITETPSAKIEICLKYAMTPSESLIKYEDKCKFDEICKQGCPNYNNKWACPPYSPKYSVISREFDNAYIFVFYCYLEQFDYINMPYMKIKASHTILKAKSNKIMRQLEKELNGVMLSNGSCRLCKTCSCKTKELQCKKIFQLRFSMESVGLNVGSITMKFLNHELLWYSKNNVPEYSSVVTTILTKQIIEENQVSKLILNINNL